jgi:uncharacterized protein (DUF58 family)
VVIILDNSASMATLDGGRPRFAAAREAAEQLLDALRPGDSVALLPTGGPPAPEHARLYQAHETVRQALAQCRVSHQRADLASRLQQARTLLAGADGLPGEIYVITDNQSLSWEGLKEDAGGEVAGRDGEVPVIVVNVNRDPLPNLALRSLRVESPPPAVGVPVQVRAEVLNTSSVPRQNRLELHLDGNREAISPPLTIAPGAAVAHEFSFTLDRGGVHHGEVRLAEEDGCPLDNRLFFALAIDRQVPVAVVKTRRHEIPYEDDTFYVEQVLASMGPTAGPCGPPC